MGLIKALTSSVSSALGDQFKEFVECPQIENNVIIQRGIVKHGRHLYIVCIDSLFNISTIYDFLICSEDKISNC